MKILLSLVVLIAAATVAPAQQPTLQDPLLDAMTGHWLLTGEVMGKVTIHEVDAAWVLNHQYVRLHEVSREKTPAGLPQYEAFVFIGWDTVKKQCTGSMCTVADSRCAARARRSPT